MCIGDSCERTASKVTIEPVEDKDQHLSLLNLLQPEVQANPYPFYRLLRETDPVHWDSPRGYPAGWWVVTRHADVSAAFQDARFSSQRFADVDRVPSRIRPVARVLSQQLLYTDPPTHTRLRALVSKAFTPREVESWRHRIQVVTNQLLDAVQDKGEMDVIRDLAVPLPVHVIADMFGVAVEDRGSFKQWSDDLRVVVGNARLSAAQAAQAVQSLDMLTTYFRTVIERRRRHPQDDLLQRLIMAEEAGSMLTEEELYANCMMVLLAGYETTSNFIGNAVLALLQHPEQCAALRADPALYSTAIPELLRYDSPAQVALRIAKEDLEFAGKGVQAGQQLLLILGAANRDPEQFNDPDRLDLSRKDNRHLAFAHGIHFCLGAALARMEGEIALTSVLQRWPTMRLATTALEWERNMTFRALKALPVTCA